MIDRFNKVKYNFPDKLDRYLKLTWVTGTLAAGLLKTFIIGELNKIGNLDVNVVAIKNDFYGESISVSGLLVGSDIYHQLRNMERGDLILLPPRVLNRDRLFLDNWTVDKLENNLHTRCCVYNEPLENIGEFLIRYGS